MHTSYFCRVGQFYCGALVGGRPAAEFMSLEDRLSAAFPVRPGENSRYVCATQSPLFTGVSPVLACHRNVAACGREVDLSQR